MFPLLFLKVVLTSHLSQFHPLAMEVTKNAREGMLSRKGNACWFLHSLRTTHSYLNLITQHILVPSFATSNAGQYHLHVLMNQPHSPLVLQSKGTCPWCPFTQGQTYTLKYKALSIPSHGKSLRQQGRKIVFCYYPFQHSLLCLEKHWLLCRGDTRVARATSSP